MIRIAWSISLCLFVVGLLCLNPPSRAQLTVMGVGGGFGGAAAAGGSAWGDKGTNVTLSTTTIANDTAANSSGVSAFSSVRGTQAYSSGKHYFEVKMITAPGSPLFIIGIMDNTTATGAAMDDTPNNIPNACGNSMFNGNTFSVNWNGVNSGSWSLVDGDYMGVAVDSDNAFSYLALNNVYFLSGDPTSGAMGTGSVCSSVGAGARPMISIFNVAGSFQLRTTSSAFQGTLPTGYSAWN